METVYWWPVDKAMSCLQNKALIRKGLPSTLFIDCSYHNTRVCVSQCGWLSSSPQDTGAGQSVFALPTSYPLPLLELPDNPLGGHVSKCMSG